MEILSPADLAQMFQEEAYGVALEASYAKRYPHPVERAAMVGKFRAPQAIALVHEVRLHRLFITEFDLNTLNDLRWKCRDGDRMFGFRKAPVRMAGVHAFFGQLCSWLCPGSLANAGCVRCDQNPMGTTAVQFIALIAARLQSTKLPILVTTCGEVNSSRLAPDMRPVLPTRFRELEGLRGRDKGAIGGTEEADQLV